MSRRIDVVMPTRNAGPYLDASIESILAQTHGDFDFLILNDGSTDGSGETLRGWARRDSRIQLFEREGRLGPAGSSNWIAERGTRPLVARMDADDIAHPDRLRRQIAAMDSNPDAALIGTGWQGIDGNGRCVRPRNRLPVAMNSRIAPFPHGSIMFRRDLFVKAGGYREGCAFWEDLDLYYRLAGFGPVLVLPDLLYSYRLSQGSTRLVSGQERVERAVEAMYRHVEALGHSGDPLEPPVDPACLSGRAIRPRVFVALSAGAVWSGRRPAMLGRLLRRGRLRPSLQSFAALAWALWGTASPRSLRLGLQMLMRISDLAARQRLADGRPVEWTGRVRPRTARPGPIQARASVAPAVRAAAGTIA